MAKAFASSIKKEKAVKTVMKKKLVVLLKQEALNLTLSEVKEFVAEYKIPYKILLPVTDSALSCIQPVPTTITIDRQGRLAKKYVGAVDESIIEAEVERLLSERSAKTGLQVQGKAKQAPSSWTR